MLNKINKHIVKTYSYIKDLCHLKSEQRIERKKELILNTITLSFALFILIIFLYYLITKILSNSLLSPLSLIFITKLLVIFILLVSIASLSRKKKLKAASILLLFCIFCMVIKISLYWEINFSLSIVLFLLIIALSHRLMSSLFSFIIATLSLITIITLSFFRINGLIETGEKCNSQYWNIINILILFVIILSVSLLLYFDRKEMENYLTMAKNSEKKLLLERNILNVNFKKRSEELKQSQLQELANFRQLAEFGRLSAGLFHELANPLTALNLSMEQMSKDCSQNEAYKGFENNIERATKAARKMGHFLKGVKKQLCHQEERRLFSLNNEIEEVLEIIEFKALRSKVNLIFRANKEFFLYNNSLKFHQVATNLISNAIDSYDKKEKKSDIVISLKESSTKIFLSVKDGGCGLSDDERSKLFNSFFSTKNYKKGTGLGLAMVKSIVEINFKGIITVYSRKDLGTEFIIELPKEL